MRYDSKSRTSHNTLIGETSKIMSVLHRANGPAASGYIALHTGIKDHLKILKEMEKESSVCRSPSSTWSCCMDLMYEVA